METHVNIFDKKDSVIFNIKKFNWIFYVKQITWIWRSVAKICL